MSAFGIDWFGLVIPGRPILVNFEMVDPTKCAATIERPGEVAEICFFLTPSGAQLPPDKCAVLYLSLDGAAWTLLGTLSLAKPSGLFRLPSDDALARAPAARLGAALGASLASARTRQRGLAHVGPAPLRARDRAGPRRVRLVVLERAADVVIGGSGVGIRAARAPPVARVISAMWYFSRCHCR